MWTMDVDLPIQPPSSLSPEGLSSSFPWMRPRRRRAQRPTRRWRRTAPRPPCDGVDEQRFPGPGHADERLAPSDCTCWDSSRKPPSSSRLHLELGLVNVRDVLDDGHLLELALGASEVNGPVEPCRSTRAHGTGRRRPSVMPIDARQGRSWARSSVSTKGLPGLGLELPGQASPSTLY